MLACGIDSLSLAIQVQWKSDRAFNLLAGLKELAKRQNDEEPARLELEGESSAWLFIVKPHGKDGYEWMLSGKEMAMRIGNWRKLKQRPSVMVDIRSEALWHHGPNTAVERVLSCIEALGGKVVSVKSSRADLCLDILLPRELWYEGLHKQFVTRARYVSPHIQGGHLSGFSIAKGLVSGRLYDKLLEITTVPTFDFSIDRRP